MNSRLWSAIKRRDEEETRKLLLQGARVDARQKHDGYTYLMLSTSCDDLTITKMLIDFGCPVNVISRYGNCTALHLAVAYVNYDIAFELIKAGANVHIKNQHGGSTALHLAVVDLTHVDLLGEVVPNVQLKEKNAYCMDCIRFADMSRSKSGICVTIASDSNNWIKKRYLLVKMLLDVGADVNAKDNNNCTAIHSAVYTGDLQLMKILIEAGADVNNQNRIGATPLHEAILCRNAEMVNLLLNSSANVSAKTVLGNTPLHWASMLNVDAAILTNLMKFQSSCIDDLNADGLSAFDVLLQNGDPMSVKLFVEKYEANLMHVDNNGVTALHHAACNPDPNLLKLVLDSTAGGLAVDQACNNGFTPLHVASKELLPQNVRLLIARGANVNAKDKHGRTALFLSVHGSNTSENLKKVTELLLEHGTDLNQKYIEREAEKTILQVSIQGVCSIVTRMIIMHAVKVELKTNQRVLDDYNLAVIQDDELAMRQYSAARNELMIMSNSVFEDTSITHLALLTGSEREVLRYARNKNLLKAFENSYDRTAYLYYGPIMKRRFDAAVAKQKDMENVCIILSELLRFAGPEHPAFEIIFHGLSDEDVKFLLENA